MNFSRTGNLCRSFQKSESGSATIIVFALIVVVASLAVSNNLTLAYLQRELRLVEQRQLQHSGAIARTNQAASLRTLRQELITSPNASKAP